jgi:hypothetical protein
MEANLALPLHEHATDVTRLITESAYGNGTLSIVGVWDVASLTSDKLEQLRTRGEREFVYAHAFDALLTNQPEWTEAFGGLTVNDIAQHMKMQTAEVIEERYQRGRAEAALADRDAEIARLTAALAAAQFDRDEAIKDFRFGVHHDCRPNRKQAESWRDQLRDETDRHADTKAALADRDATIARLREVMQRAADALESDSTLEQRVAAWDAIADCFEPALTPAKEADRG